MSEAAPRIQGAFVPTSVDADARTIEVTFTTGADTKRGGAFEEPYVERLRVDERSVNLQRLNNGAPVLDSHVQPGVRNTLGVVERAWIVDGKGHALLRFSTRPEVEGVWQDVQNGILRSVSVGYTRDRVVATNEKVNGLPVRVVEAWEPHEISLISIPADAGAQVLTLTKELSTMDNETVPTSEPQETPAVSGDVQTVDRSVAVEIISLCERHKLGADFSTKLIAEGATLDEARTKVLETLENRSEQTQVRQ